MMAVKLQLKNGKIKKFSTWCDKNVTVEYGGYTVSKCGRRQDEWRKDRECEHIDCAIYAAECRAENGKNMAASFFGMSLLMILLGLISSERDLAGVGVIGTFLGIPIWVFSERYYKNNNPKKELIEFRDYGTVNGVKAHFINSFDAVDYYNKGIDLINMGKYEEAIQAFDKAVERNPKIAAAWNNKGEALNNLSKYNEAIKVFDKAIEINPQYAMALYNKGISLRAMHRNVEAEAAFAKAKVLRVEASDAFAKAKELGYAR